MFVLCVGHTNQNGNTKLDIRCCFSKSVLNSSALAMWILYCAAQGTRVMIDLYVLGLGMENNMYLRAVS